MWHALTLLKYSGFTFRDGLTHFFPFGVLKNQFFKKRVFKYSIGDLECGMRHIVYFTPGPVILNWHAKRN
jgi:hypothetical protein